MSVNHSINFSCLDNTAYGAKGQKAKVSLTTGLKSRCQLSWFLLEAQGENLFLLPFPASGRC